MVKLKRRNINVWEKVEDSIVSKDVVESFVNYFVKDGIEITILFYPKLSARKLEAQSSFYFIFVKFRRNNVKHTM